MRLFTSTGGAQALEILRVQSVRVIVSDQHMPGMLGIELPSKVCQESPDAVCLHLPLRHQAHPPGRAAAGGIGSDQEGTPPLHERFALRGAPAFGESVRTCAQG
jgi:CheY-like chemotaxis protein